MSTPPERQGDVREIHTQVMTIKAHHVGERKYSPISIAELRAIRDQRFGPEVADLLARITEQADATLDHAENMEASQAAEEPPTGSTW